MLWKSPVEQSQRQGLALMTLGWEILRGLGEKGWSCPPCSHVRLWHSHKWSLSSGQSGHPYLDEGAGGESGWLYRGPLWAKS